MEVWRTFCARWKISANFILSEIYFILRHENPYRELWYYGKIGALHREKFLVSETTNQLSNAIKFEQITEAFSRRSVIWGIWEVVAMPSNEVIDQKFYEQNH